jgi:O-acetyl-ADP-ribose deacetylase (regulator of RNase III)
MVSVVSGNLLRADVEALVNSVNCLGVMGKGVALEFKQAFPDNFREYAKACKLGQVMPGRMHVFETGRPSPRLIINFPTKQDWRQKAKLEYVEAGLEDLVKVLEDHEIRSVAIPPLGCGLGGLDWTVVRPMIEAALIRLPRLDAWLYEPSLPEARGPRVVNTPRPVLTPWQAALIKLVDRYEILDSEATHLEAQKLTYFLVEAGIPFRTQFDKHRYGPYAPGIKHSLQLLEGHYVDGFGDGGRLDPVRLVPGAMEDATELLNAQPEALQYESAIARIGKLIHGFESPYGLELLATVHWVVHRDGAHDLDAVVGKVHAWNERKQRLMERYHLEVTYERLRSHGWLVEGGIATIHR